MASPIRHLIEEAVKTSMRDRNKERTSTLRMALSELKKEEIDEVELVVECPKEWSSYILHKGYVAINGASLTVAEKQEGSFSVYLIPETLNATNLSKISDGDLLNIEIDQATYAAIKAAEERLKEA